MGMMRSLWASVQGDPVFMRKINGWFTMFWLLNFPVVIGLYFAAPKAWASMSILYLALVSIYANVAGHLSSWQAARVEVKQDEQDVGRDVIEAVKRDPEIVGVTLEGEPDGRAGPAC